MVFFSVYTNPPTFEACMLKSHLPMQHTASAKLELSRSHLSWVPQKTKRTPIERKQKLSGKQTCGLNTWNGAFGPLYSCWSWRKCMTTATRLLENKCLCNTESLSNRKLWLAFQKSASATAGPHKGDTVPFYQPPCALMPERRRPLKKKKFPKICFKSSCTMGLIEKA